MHYPLIHQSNERPYHFIHGYVQYLEQQLQVRIPLTRFHGDVHLAPEEKRLPFNGQAAQIAESFWIVMAGGKYDFTAKWWSPDCYQKVVDHFRGQIQFVQCGEEGHWHPRLKNVVDLVGKTNLREFIRLMHHAAGVVCPVTFAMHLAAAVETRPGKPRRRPCVVVAGGREPPHWEAYPHHQFLSTVGALPCCAEGGCWKSRCQLVGDGDAKDRRDLCEQPVQVSADLRIAKCMHMITPEDVIRRIELYFEGGAMRSNGSAPPAAAHAPAEIRAIAAPAASPDTVLPRDLPERHLAKHEQVLVRFPHGLGDAVQLTIVLKHLSHYFPGWQIDVAAPPSRLSVFQGLCRQTLAFEEGTLDPGRYDRLFDLHWELCDGAYVNHPSTKASKCLVENFQVTPMGKLCSYCLQVSNDARNAASRYLEKVCSAGRRPDRRFAAVLIHYQGATSANDKDLPDDAASHVCDLVRERGFVPVLLDWNNNSPLIGRPGVRNPGPGHELWSGKDWADAQVLAALIEQSALMIGVDSGPLHVAGATATPTLGVWTRHHPAHYFDLADNVAHLVPEQHETLLRGQEALRFFTRNYRFRTYRELETGLLAAVDLLLTGASVDGLEGRQAGYGERYYHVHKADGLDLLAYGRNEEAYGNQLMEALSLRGKRLLDVGCGGGAILRGLAQAGAIVTGVDVNEWLIQRGRDQWPDLAHRLVVCDAVNLHSFADDAFDAVHAAHVGEHWKPELVPFILRELARVTQPGGVLFATVDTDEVYARRQGRPKPDGPGKLWIHPIRWWYQRLKEAGWDIYTPEFAVDESVSSFSDSDCLLARKR